MKSMKSRRKREKIVNVLCFLAVLFFAALAMLPIWWIFRSSLMSNAELFKWPPAFFPPRWLFSNYANSLQYFKFWTYLKNTMTIIIPSVVGGTITATMCGYAFARLRFRGKDFLFTLCIGSMLLPTMVTLIPLYIMWTKFLGLSDTYWPLILPYFCGGGAFNIFLIRQFVLSVPRELDEAATIDGAGYFRILTSIIVPSIKPAMIVVAMFLFIQIWNDLLQQMVYINTEAKFTISMGLSQLKGSLKTDWSAIMCGTCMSFVPGVVFYLIGQRYFVEGIVMTGMKNCGHEKRHSRAPGRGAQVLFPAENQLLDAVQIESVDASGKPSHCDDPGGALRGGSGGGEAGKRRLCAVVGGIPGRIPVGFLAESAVGAAFRRGFGGKLCAAELRHGQHRKPSWHDAAGIGDFPPVVCLQPGKLRLPHAGHAAAVQWGRAEKRPDSEYDLRRPGLGRPGDGSWRDPAGLCLLPLQSVGFCHLRYGSVPVYFVLPPE